MKPFEVAANRVARPFRDAYNWFDGLTTARSENQKLKKEVAPAAAGVRDRAVGARTRTRQLQSLLDYERGPSFPKDFKR